MPYDLRVITDFSDRLHRAYSRSGYRQDFVEFAIECGSFDKAVGAVSARYWYKRLESSTWVGDITLLPSHDAPHDESPKIEWVDDLTWWLYGSLKPWQPESDTEPPDEELGLDVLVRKSSKGSIRVLFTPSTQPFLDNVWG